MEKKTYKLKINIFDHDSIRSACFSNSGQYNHVILYDPLAPNPYWVFV